MDLINVIVGWRHGHTHSDAGAYPAPPDYRIITVDETDDAYHIAAEILVELTIASRRPLHSVRRIVHGLAKLER